MRIMLPKPMRVFRRCPENAQCIALTRETRTEKEVVEIGPIIDKRWDDRERLVVPLEGHHAGQFLLVSDLDERAQGLNVEWMIECGHARYVSDPLAKSEKWKKAEAIKEQLEIYLQAFAPRHLRRVS